MRLLLAKPWALHSPATISFSSVFRDFSRAINNSDQPPHKHPSAISPSSSCSPVVHTFDRPGPGTLVDTMSSSPAPVESPNQYSLVSDTYGPGVVLAWILVAYTIAAHIIERASPGIDTIKRDLLITVSFPAGVAVHLVILVSQYPDPYKEIWTTTENKLLPYATAIWAPAVVCRIASA